MRRIQGDARMPKVSEAEWEEHLPEKEFRDPRFHQKYESLKGKAMRKKRFKARHAGVQRAKKSGRKKFQTTHKRW